MKLVKIFFVAHRQYNNKDLIDDQYGRYWEIPQRLSELGHDVLGSCFSMNLCKEGCVFTEQIKSKNFLKWYSFNAGPIKLFGLLKYLCKSIKLARNFKPDIIYATSNPLSIILAYCIAKQVKAKFIFDLYDNVETYGFFRTPGMLFLFRNVVLRADGVTTMSVLLTALLRDRYKYKGVTEIIDSGAETHFFYPRDKEECRKQLGLPIDAEIIGTAGALQSNRGIENVFKVFDKLAVENSKLHLAFSGPCGEDINIPKGLNIHYFGNLPFEKVPILINSLDLAIICNKNSEFGRYSVPQKTYEFLACKVPLVVADVGVLSIMFDKYPEYLYQPENQKSLEDVIKNQLKESRIIECELPTWEKLVSKLELLLFKVVKS